MTTSQLWFITSFVIKNTPYAPNLFHVSGTYRLDVGPLSYFGSTTSVGARWSEHRTRLERGDHPNPLLQEAWDQHGTAGLMILLEIPRKSDDSDKDHRDRLRLHEQQLLDEHFGTDGCANRSDSANHNSNVSRQMKMMWADPEWARWQKSLRAAAALNRGPVSAATRAKMAAAKTGARNHNARECCFRLREELFQFPAASEAAEFFGVKQQTMDLWLRGMVSWPGSGSRPPRPASRHLIGLRGWYGTEADDPHKS